MRKFAIVTIVTAAAVYFLNPSSGAQRRAAARERLLSLFRRGERTFDTVGSAVGEETSAFTPQASTEKEQPSQPDDVTLARLVESELFRDEDAAKSHVNVNAENGRIVLRGEVAEPEMIADLEDRTRKVRGVQEVENLLHVQGTPAPAHR